MRYTNVVVAAALAAVASAASVGEAGAQAGSRPFSLGISGGASFPVGEGSDGVDMGFNVTGHLAVQPSVSPVGLRFDLGYNRWAVDGFDANVRTISGTANAMFMLPASSGSSIRPYISGGLGLYNSGVSGDDVPDNTDSETDFGLNGGVGIDFGLSGLATFVEARYHTIFTEGSRTSFIPVVFGIRF